MASASDGHHSLLRQSEVENLYAVVAQHEDVFRLQVAMNNAFLVRGGQPLGDLQSVFNDPALRQRARVHAIAQRFAFQKLRHQEVHAVLRADVVDRHQVGMIECAEDAGFLLKALQAFAIVGKRLRKDLDGDGAIQASVAGAIHFAHSSCPDCRKDFIGA